MSEPLFFNAEMFFLGPIPAAFPKKWLLGIVFLEFQGTSVGRSRNPKKLNCPATTCFSLSSGAVVSLYNSSVFRKRFFNQYFHNELLKILTL